MDGRGEVTDLNAFAEAIDKGDYDPSARSSQSLGETVKEIRFHAEYRFWQFTPCYGDDFEHRLLAWLNNPSLTVEDKVELLRLLPDVAFIDRDDMMSLYRSAFCDNVRRWVMDQEGLDFRLSESRLRRRLDEAVSKTWICPLTDSLDISQFHHANNLSTHSQRPQWRTLQHFGSVRKIRAYVRSLGIRRLVLVEDVVGSGAQSSTVLRSVVRELVPGLPVLFVPLVTSHTGLRRAAAVLAEHRVGKVDPVVVVPRIVHVQSTVTPYEPDFVAKARSIVERTRGQFGRRRFGYGGVGSLVVLYTNCPNTTLPMIWSVRKGWRPIFPRVSRPRD